jgi:hypothetical protein
LEILKLTSQLLFQKKFLSGLKMQMAQFKKVGLQQNMECFLDPLILEISVKPLQVNKAAEL